MLKYCRPILSSHHAENAGIKKRKLRHLKSGQVGMENSTPHRRGTKCGHGKYGKDSVYYSYCCLHFCECRPTCMVYMNGNLCFQLILLYIVIVFVGMEPTGINYIATELGIDVKKRSD